MAESDQQQQNLRRPQAGDGPIKYGDVFKMSGDMAGQPISPRDAAAMQSAENSAFGKTIKGGPASLMLSAAAMNVEAGLVPPGDAAAAQPATAQELVEGKPWHESQPAHEQMESVLSPDDTGYGGGAAGITIGEALQAAAEAIGDKPVDRADAVAIRAAEMRATGTNAALGSGIGAEAQAAATVNARMKYDEDKTKLSDIIGGAVNTLTDDKPATTRDAELVSAAELRGGPEGAIKQTTTPGGVAEAVTTAARINEAEK